MLLQETYAIEDTICYDHGLSTDYNSDMYNYSNRLTITRDTNGTLLINSNESSDGYFLANKGGTPSGSNPNVTEFTTPLVMELDVISWGEDTITSLYVSDGTNLDSNFTFENRVTSNNHVKLTYIDGKFNMWVDNTRVVTDYAKEFNEPFRIGLRVGRSSNLKYKNFKIHIPYAE